VATDAQGDASTTFTANAIAGTYTVAASATSITGSAAFVLTNLPLGSGVLAFVQQPRNTAAGQVITQPVTVQVQDGSGHGVAVAGVPIVVSLFSGTGTLQGTLVQLTDSTGTVTFSDLSIAQTGVKQLGATSTGQVPATSVMFQITAGAAASISVFAGSPQFAFPGKPFPTALQAQVTDSARNPVSGVAVAFAIASSSGAGGTFDGPTTVTSDASGIATAPTLTANSQAGAFPVTASTPGVASQAVFSLINLPPTTGIAVNPSQLTFSSEANQKGRRRGRRFR
jgi:adhesin/invasin